MADLKISQLSDGGNSQATDEYVIARSGSNFRIDGASIAAAATSVGTLSSLTVSGAATFASSTGNVGIGTTSPTDTGGFGKALDIRSAGGGQVIIRDSDDTARFGRFAYDGTDNSARVEATGTGSVIRFLTAGSEKMLLDASGNLGLGVTPPAWEAGTVSLNVGTGSTLWNPGSGTTTRLITNAFRPTGGSYTLRTNGGASMYEHSGNVHNWYNVAAGNQGDTFTFTQAMTLDASGNLGVGTASPESFGTGYRTIESSGTAGAYVVVKRTDSTAVTGEIFAGPGAVYVSSKTNHPLIFRTNDTERARITSGGVFMVGTTGLPLADGTACSMSGSGNVMRVYGTTEGSSAIVVDKSSNTSTTAQVFVAFTINAQNTGSGQINANGASQAAFGSFSDARLKDNIVDLPSQWDAIKTIRPVEFDYIESEGGGHQIGFVAQEIQEVYPDLVGERADGMLTLTGLGKNEARLIKALQEAMARIEALEARLEALEA